MKDLTTKILWAVYVGLLLVLLPHTAWLFSNFESTESTIVLGYEVNAGEITAWAGAFAFEAAIAVLTHKLAKHIEARKRFAPAPRVFGVALSFWPKFSYRYLNTFSAGLVVAVAVSALANLAHSVQYGRPLTIFASWGIPVQVYQLAFGGVLPIVSLLFARVLSDVSENDDAPNPELEQANGTIKELRSIIRSTEQRIADAERRILESEQRANVAEQRANNSEAIANEVTAKFSRLFGEDKRDRIVVARELWPTLSVNGIATIADVSPSYASEVVNKNNGVVKHE